MVTGESTDERKGEESLPVRVVIGTRAVTVIASAIVVALCTGSSSVLCCRPQCSGVGQVERTWLLVPWPL